MYTYGWFMLLYGRNHHNIVKQLFLIENKVKIKLKKKVEASRKSCI